MRNRNLTATTAAASSLVNDGINSNSILEFRATLAKATGDNQVQFYFHGGKITKKHSEDVYFGEFRPMPWVIDRKTKQAKIDEQGNQVRSTVWTQHVSKPSFNLTPQDQAIIAMVSQQPEFASALIPTLSEEGQKALNSGGLIYEAFDWETTLNHLLGHTQVKFSFTLPSRFNHIIDTVKELLVDKEPGTNYSLVIRFDAAAIKAKSDLKEEYNTNILRKDVYITPTYVGFIDGITRTEDDLAGIINPNDVMSALNAGKAAHSMKQSNPYISKEYLAEQAKRVNERIAATGTGKKAHQPLVQEIFDSAASGETAKFEEAVKVLEGIEARGTNKAVPIGYTNSIKEKALVSEQKIEAPVPNTAYEEYEEPQTQAMSENDLADLLFDD